MFNVGLPYIKLVGLCNYFKLYKIKLTNMLFKQYILFR